MASCTGTELRSWPSQIAPGCFGPVSTGRVRRQRRRRHLAGNRDIREDDRGCRPLKHDSGASGLRTSYHRRPAQAGTYRVRPFG